jgi:hypothetical protein
MDGINISETVCVLVYLVQQSHTCLSTKRRPTPCQGIDASPLNLAPAIQQLSRRSNFRLVVTRLARTGVPHNLAQFLRRKLLELPDCRGLRDRHLVVVLGAALAGRGRGFS